MGQRGGAVWGPRLVPAASTAAGARLERGLAQMRQAADEQRKELDALRLTAAEHQALQTRWAQDTQTLEAARVELASARADLTKALELKPRKGYLYSFEEIENAKDKFDPLLKEARVAQELHSQYLIGFSPDNRDGKTHKLDVRVATGGLKARGRKSYVAPKK